MVEERKAYSYRSRMSIFFVNADLIAHGLSQISISARRKAIEAGRLMVKQIKNCVRRSEPFAFDTTFSGKGFVEKIIEWQNKGYEIITYFLNLYPVAGGDSLVRYHKIQ